MRTKAILSVLLLSAAMCSSALAQEFRIYTKVFDQTRGGNDPAGWTLTMFHAGRVYDYIDSAGEVVIFEPMQKRFIVLNTERKLKTVVHFNEINRLLDSAHKVAQERIDELQNEPGGKPTAEMLAFQLNPEFRVDVGREKRSLSLVDAKMRYDATLKQVETPETAAAYRNYADWISRLNFVLHPHALLPGPRLELNKHLATQQSLPVKVHLEVNTRPRLKLRAEHTMHWSLDAHDRSLIQGWNQQLTGKEMRKVPLREYQRAMGIHPVSRK